LSVPLNDPDIVEKKLYDEAFVFYDAKDGEGNGISVYQIDTQRLCLLEEGHCMRTQVLHLCESHKIRFNPSKNLRYKVGSIDSLLRFVDASRACTLVPVQVPVPYRSIGLAVHRHFVKKKILAALQEEVLAATQGLLPEVHKGEQLLPL